MSAVEIERPIRSRAEERRIRNEHRFRIAQEAAAAKTGEAQPRVIKKRAEIERKPGLRWLLSKNKITPEMCRAGERYALGVRVASCADAAAIRGCLASLEGIRGSGAVIPHVRDREELEAAEWITEYRRQTIYIRTRLFDDVELMGVLDSIAIRQLSPREITSVQREAEILEGVAYTVLKMLIGILRDYDKVSQPGMRIEDCAG